MKHHTRVTIRSSLAVGLLICLAVLLAGCPTPPPTPEPPAPPVPSLAPGLVITVANVAIPADLRPEVVFTITDSKGNPVAFKEMTDLRVILAFLTTREGGMRDRFESYSTTVENPDGIPGSGDEAVQATYDSARLNGVTSNDDGTFTYKFATVLPANYSQSATHQLGIQSQRTYPVDNQSYPANTIYRFRPDGLAVASTREIVDTATCNNCHTRLSAHGSRREVQLCILCHNSQTFDGQSGNSVNMATMIHKIHMGENLPSVESGEPYQIIGFRNSVNDYSTVVFPQDIRNCEVCHQSASQSHAYLNEPTRAGCFACHDRTWYGNPDETPEGYENHIGGQQVDDSLCTLCHTPTSPGSAPIAEAHLVPTESNNAPGLMLDVEDVQIIATETANNVKVLFLATNGDGTPIADLNDLSSMSLNIAYPAPEYETNVRESARSTSSPPPGVLENLGNGHYAYTFKATFPLESDLTYAVGLEGRRNFEFREEEYEQGTSSNGLTYFTLDGSEPTARRSVVDGAKCNKCHNEIRAHGAQRFGADYCVFCHRPNGTDTSRRPQDKMPPATINFKDMIHRIHTGEELESEYTVYGFGGTAYDFTEVRFPGERRVCGICHRDGSTDLPLPEEALPTVVRQGETLISEVLPERAACTSCHDSLLANVHAVLGADSQSGVETCAVCHGPGAEFAIAEVHRLGP